MRAQIVGEIKLKTKISRSKLVLAASIASALSMSMAVQGQIQISNADGPNEGLNDTTAANPVSGNTGTTIGAQRINVFQAAADWWNARLNVLAVVEVEANFDPLACSVSSGVLGSAGALWYAKPQSDSAYSVAALYNQIVGADYDSASAEIGAVFNSEVGSSTCLSSLSWWYGIDAAAPSGTISLFDTALHEIGHGLGFASTMQQNGTFPLTSGFPDRFTEKLYSISNTSFLTALTSVQRSAAAANGNNTLAWNGVSVNQAIASCAYSSGLNSGLATMYAPLSYNGGSSVSHWNTSVNPDELMEPFATATSYSALTLAALEDIGWSLTSPTVVQDACPPEQSRSSILPLILPIIVDD
ncbi:leishmanolysin-related zinc metalloendopeptidase [Gammaproteobacteria bacterium]|nr:leishmanolysin-related zinc metalloendopeptidase [Gammaproteobacteria bacterium]